MHGVWSARKSKYLKIHECKNIVTGYFPTQIVAAIPKVKVTAVNFQPTLAAWHLNKETKMRKHIKDNNLI